MVATRAPKLWLEGEEVVPRFREVGDVTLDLMHRDGRVEDRWLGLHPREFQLLWRLLESPGEPVSRRQLLSEVWRIDYEPNTNSVAVHVARVRSKLAVYGLSGILLTHPDGGYLVDPLPGSSAFRFDRPD